MPFWLQNLFVLGSLALAVTLLRVGSRNERWQRAWKAMKKDRLGLIAGAVIALYLLVGILDLLKLSPSLTCLDWLLLHVVGFQDERVSNVPAGANFLKQGQTGFGG